MTRVAIESIVLFLIPFALFALWLIATRRSLVSAEDWNGKTGWLVLYGLVAVIGGFAYTALQVDPQMRPYEPTHLENGKLVPGRFN